MDKISHLVEFKTKSYNGGGKDKIEMQHNLGKMTARERVLFIFDEGTFIEIGGLTNANGAGVITGYGTIRGKLVYIYSQDYTVNGGAIDKINTEKIINIMDMAVKMGAPLIQIVDSLGAKLEDNLDALECYGKIINKNTQLSGVVPQISIIAGPCSGIASLSAVLSDFTIIVKDMGELYLNPQERLINKEQKYVDSNMYADAKGSSENGSVQITASDEKEAFDLTKKLLEYIPSNNMELIPYNEGMFDLNSEDENLNEMSKEEKIEVYEVIKSIADRDSIIEFNKSWEEKIITCFIKINGITVGVVANNEDRNEGVGIKACDKVVRFTRLCNGFNISILSIVNTEGFKVSLKEEKEGLSLYASKLLYAFAQADVPKVSLIVGKAYGTGYTVFADKNTSFDISYAWPNAKVCVTSPERLIKILHKDEIDSGEKPLQKEKEVIDKYIDEVTSIFKASSKGYIDDILMPRETKKRLFTIFDMLQSKRNLKYPKKHGSTWL